MATMTKVKADSQVKGDVLNELKWDSRVDDTEVGVQVHDGIVTLTGNVIAYAKRVAAQKAAHRVDGVLDVVDNLKVKVPSIWERSDEDVAKTVRNTLKWDVLVPEAQITSTVVNGVVTLEGTVDKWSQRVDAERAVHRLAGVKGLDNKIIVSAPPVDANKVKQGIEEALDRQTRREARRITVAVHDGVVTLTGTVRSWGERDAIEKAAGNAPGVIRVNDQTSVNSSL